MKTVENVERSANVYVFTLAKLAKGLGVEYVALVAGGRPPPEPPKPQRCIEIKLVVKVPFDQFDESEQSGGFIDFLKKFIRGGGDINVIGVTPSSTLITVAASIEDMLALSSALKEGKVAEVHVTELRPSLNTDLISPGYKTYNPQFDAKSSLADDPSKDDVAQSKIEPQERKDKKHKPDTKQ